MGSHYKYNGIGNEGRKEFVNQLKKVWGDDAIAFENSEGEPVQNYASGDSCPVLHGLRWRYACSLWVVSRVIKEEKECIKIRHWLDATSYCRHYGMPKT